MEVGTESLIKAWRERQRGFIVLNCVGRHESAMVLLFVTCVALVSFPVVIALFNICFKAVLSSQASKISMGLFLFGRLAITSLMSVLLAIIALC